MQALRSCLQHGAFSALWSLDPNFYDLGQSCTEFHGDNFVGFINFALAGICLAVALLVVGTALKEGIPSATSGQYLMFTVFFVRKQALLRAVMWLGLVVMIGMMISVPFVVFFAIPLEVLDRVSIDRLQLVLAMLKTLVPSYATVFLVAWHLKDDPQMAVDFTCFVEPGIEVQRTWKNFLLQTNRECLEQISRAIVKAKYGDYEKLKSLLVTNDDKTMKKIVKRCNPNVCIRKASWSDLTAELAKSFLHES
eukprot:CAMPEP_0172737772 /NCGR_PEP_ID=MMETSP1074-20121228/118547_1 /TAXON_ID=2916 /ORGANISM="Ceratium fusus, Strain PA161109" /LENGTH=250 /DNA_ID=CAMNT_0013567251 /DNA_START=282 /DNA_END=1030 /DNA_ORIENTATION=-